MLRTSPPLAHCEEGALKRKLRERPGLAQFHVPPKVTCKTGEGKGHLRRAPAVLLVTHQHPVAGGAECGSAKSSGLGHLVLKYASRDLQC